MESRDSIDHNMARTSRPILFNYIYIYCSCARKSGRRKNNAGTDKEEEKKLAGTLPDALEGMVNGKKVRGRRRYQLIDNIIINGLYEDTKKKDLQIFLPKGRSFTANAGTKIAVVQRLIFHCKLKNQGCTLLGMNRCA